MKVTCPKCKMEMELDPQTVNNHVRLKHQFLSDNGKFRLRCRIIPFVDVSGFSSARSVEEHQLTKNMGLK